jgi:excisionase family DNA binding protein
MTEQLYSSSQPEGLIDAVEAAKYLGLSTVHVRKMAREGELPAVNFGRGKKHGAWRFRRSNLDRYCDAQLSSEYSSTPPNGQ